MRQTIDDDPSDMEPLLDECARRLVRDPDPGRLLREMAEFGPLLFPDMLTDDVQEVVRAPQAKVLRAEAPQFFRSLGWVLASAMPLPSNGWRPQRLPLPGRNEPCLCGSLRKFKHCCAPLVARAPRLDAAYLASLVIRQLPASDRAALPVSRVPLAGVVLAADALREAGQLREAMRLLEPWSKLPATWKEGCAELLDLLADLYLDLGHPRKRRALADAMVERGDTVVQSLGWQRRSMMASDAGDAVAAREAFERAQRLTPDEPRVALLEVTTLLGSGDLDRAHERAAFHARRQARLPHAAELAPQIEGLLAIARGEMDHLPALSDDGPTPSAAVDAGTVFDDLAQWVQSLPPPRLRLDLSGATPEDLGELQPARTLAAALARWRKAFGGAASTPDEIEPLQRLDVGAWAAMLRRTPALLDCFEVLDDLVSALDAVPLGLAAALQATLLLRAVELWAQLRQRFPVARCEWGWIDNRPALRLLVCRVQLDRTPRAESSFEELRALVEVLNPNDNHGLRDRLAAVLLRRGDAAGALALAERYPDDFVGLQLLHARALLSLQRLPEAATLFDAALRDNPHLLPLLLSSRAPRLPQVASYAVGSPEQARIVVAEQHDLWRDPAIRAWVKARPTGADAPVQLPLV